MLPYTSTVTKSPKPLESVDILKSCPNLEVLVRPPLDGRAVLFSATFNTSRGRRLGILRESLEKSKGGVDCRQERPEENLQIPNFRHVPTMYFDVLPNEIITQIFLSLPNISSAISLSETCHRYRNVYQSSKKLLILSEAAEAEYGPLDDIIQLVTHNSSQPAHVTDVLGMIGLCKDDLRDGILDGMSTQRFAIRRLPRRCGRDHQLPHQHVRLF